LLFYFFIFSGKAFRFQFDFFRQRLGFSRLRSIGNIYKNYYWFGQTIIDKIVLMSRMKNPFRFEFEVKIIYGKWSCGIKGGLLLSAHVGNWE